MQNLDIRWHASKVSSAMREQVNEHRSAILWFTGLSGAGKSTIAHAVEEALFARGCSAYVLDGDNVRHGLCADLGFSAEDRVENIRRIGEVAGLFLDAGLIVLAAFISPYRYDRDRIRQKIAPGRFIEIFCDTPIDVCERRDVKGLYAKARAGQIKNFTGISAPYEKPGNPELVLDTANQSTEECVQVILNLLLKLDITN